MRNSRFSGIFGWLITGMLVSGGLTGCTKAVSTATSTSTEYTYVSVMDLAPYSPTAQVYLNGTAATSSITPGNYSTSYAPLTPGAYDIQFKASATDSILAEIPSSLYDSMSFYTLILYNTSGSSVNNAIKIVDDFSTLATGSANYRFFNMCPDFPSVDLYFNNSAGQLARTTADNVSNTAFNAFQIITPAVYTIQAKKAGTDSTVATLNELSLSAGNAYTIFLSGSSSNTTDPVSLNVVQASY